MPSDLHYLGNIQKSQIGNSCGQTKDHFEYTIFKNVINVKVDPVIKLAIWFNV